MMRKGFEFRLARDWDRTSSVLALLANVNSGKGKSFSPKDFHPLMDVSSGGKVTTSEERDALMEQLKDF